MAAMHEPSHHDAATSGVAPPVALSRRPVERVLPVDLLATLQAAVAGLDHVTPALAARLDRQFHIRRQHGITSRRLGNYLNRLDRTAAVVDRQEDIAAPTKPNQEDNKQEEQAASDWNEKLLTHRRRQASVGSILDAAFGRLADCSPDLWERRTYLMLVGTVYERLATCESDLPTEDLVKLAKVLAENRRIEARTRDQTEGEGTPASTPAPEGDLPEAFADVVRQVYGSRIPTPKSVGSDTAAAG